MGEFTRVRRLFVGSVFPSSWGERFRAESSPTIEAQRALLGKLANRGWRPEKILTTPPLRRSPPHRPEVWPKTMGGALEDCPETQLVPLGFTNVEPCKTLSIARDLRRELVAWVEDCQRNGARPQVLVYNLGPTHEQGGFLARLHDRLPFQLCPLITDLDFHGSRASLGKRIRFRWQSCLPRAADRLMALNQSVLDDFGGEKPCLHARGLVVDEQLFEKLLALPCPVPREGKPLAFYYGGSLNEVRGARRLIEAFADLDPARFRLEISGRGPLCGWIRERAASLPQVTWLGNLLSQEERLAAYARAEVVVNPHGVLAPEARYLAPSKVAEYAASGRVVLSADLPGMGSWKGSGIFLYEGDSVQALRKACRALESMEPEARGTRARESRAWARGEFSTDRLAGQIMDFLGEDL